MTCNPKAWKPACNPNDDVMTKKTVVFTSEMYFVVKKPKYIHVSSKLISFICFLSQFLVVPSQWLHLKNNTFITSMISVQFLLNTFITLFSSFGGQQRLHYVGTRYFYVCKFNLDHIVKCKFRVVL